MAIKAVIFDCFGVLVMSGHALLFHDFPQLKAELIRLQLLSDSGEISRQQFDDTVSKSTGLSPQQVEEQYWRVNKFNQSMIDWVRDLKRSGQYKIGMLSNVSRDWMDVILPVFEGEDLFDAVILSGDVKTVKPNPAIFQMMSDKLNLAPNECVMIDDMAANIKGAKAAGFQGIVYISKDQSQVELGSLLEPNNA